jgi:hypothetical protein
MRAFNSLILLSSVCVLSGCGENTVKLDVARSLSESTATSMSQTAAYFDEAESRRRAMAATYVAQDPSCLPKRKFQIQVPAASNPRPNKKVSLCIDGNAASGFEPRDIDFSPTSETLLKSRTLMIAAVADYGRAIAKILDNKDADVKGELTSFAEKIDRVRDLLSFLADAEGVPTASGVLQTPEGQSVLALLDFAVKLKQEADKVRGVEKLVERDGVKVDEALASLRTDVEVRAQGSIRGSLNVNINALYDAYDRHRYKMTFSERRAAALEIFEAEDESQGLKQKAKVVIAALTETMEAQKGLRAALRDDFTPAQRRKAAAINLDRITQAMKLVASVGTAFS